MSLADRIARAAAPDVPAQTKAPRKLAAAQPDAFAALKRRVHQELLDSLGPQLYDPHMSESDLAVQVRTTLRVVLEQEEAPLTAADRARRGRSAHRG